MDGDAQLLARYASTQDADAFTQLVRRHGSMVFAVAQRITLNHHDAEEITQGCFMELAKRAGMIRGSPATWLHLTAIHRAMDATRAVQRRRQRERVAAKPEVQLDGGWGKIAPLVDAAIVRLPEEQRLPLILYHLEGRSQAEVAVELGINQSTVSRRIEAAVENLRQKLEAAGVSSVPCAALPALLAKHAIMAMPKELVSELGKLAVAGLLPAAKRAAPVKSSYTTVKAGLGPGSKIAVGLVLALTMSTVAVRLMPARQEVVIATAAQTVNPGPAVAPKDALIQLDGIHSASYKIDLVTYYRGFGSNDCVGEGLDVAEPARMREVLRERRRTSIKITDWAAARVLTLDPRHKDGKLLVLGDTSKEGDLIAQLKRYAAKDFDQVGQEQIDGSAAIRYHVKSKGADEDDVTIWVDGKTRLPVRMETKSIAFGRTRETLSDFKWNVSYDDAAFSLASPAGYRIDIDAKPLSIPTENDLIEALRATAQLNKNTFLDHLDMTSVRKWFMPQAGRRSNPKNQAVLDKADTIFSGIEFTYRFDQDDWHYAGKGVSLDQPNTPIVWYRPRAGANYRVINADLTVHEVSADALPSVASETFHNAVSNERKLVPRFIAALPQTVVTAAKHAPWGWLPWASAVVVFGLAGLLRLRQRQRRLINAPLRGFQGSRR